MFLADPKLNLCSFLIAGPDKLLYDREYSKYKPEN